MHGIGKRIAYSTICDREARCYPLEVKNLINVLDPHTQLHNDFKQPFLLYIAYR
jgi:hypothetical protein